MNNIEEQNMTRESNPDVKGNMVDPTRAPSAKKVYSKPMLVLLLPHHTDGKNFFSINEPNDINWLPPFSSDL
jgi:hypothetical protein